MSKLTEVIERLRALPADEAEALAHEIEGLMAPAGAAPGWQSEELARRQAEPLDLVPENEMQAFFARRRP